jgi:hypothetical protein
MLFDKMPLHDFPDRALRQALEHPQNLRDVVTAARPELAPRLDFTQAEYLRPAFLLEDWRGREADLLCRVPYRDPSGDLPSVMICLLMEHQSRPDPRLPLRQLLYGVLYWEQEWKEYEARHPLGESLRLTPVVPIVFHTGSREWNSNRTVGELFAAPEGLRVFAPTWPVVYWDLAARTSDELLGADGPFMQFLAVVRAEESEREEFRRVIIECAKRLEPVHGQDKMRWRDLLTLMVSWILQRRASEERDEMTAAVVASQQSVLAREEAATVSEKTKLTWAQEYQQQQGRLARLATLRETLVLLLTDKFSALPADLAESIQACEDAAKLQAAIRRVRTLTSLDEFSL